MALKNFLSFMGSLYSFKIGREELQVIAETKFNIELLYENGISNLSLESLELSRRFNKLYWKVKHREKVSRYDFQQLFVIARHLQQNLKKQQQD